MICIKGDKALINKDIKLVYKQRDTVMKVGNLELINDGNYLIEIKTIHTPRGDKPDGRPYLTKKTTL